MVYHLVPCRPRFVFKGLFCEKEENTEDDPYELKIWEGYNNAWYFLMISLTDITFRLERQYNNNAHKAWKVLIYKYDVSCEKQESLN